MHPPTNFRPSTLPSNLLDRRRSVDTETAQQEEEESNSEKKPLLKH